LEFPWGRQHFWGDWNVYNWFLGQLAPQPLECAFLALRHWSFKQIEAGRSVDEVVRLIIEGNECYAVLGLALTLALETYHVSSTILPIVTCQRLWQHDIARMVQEPNRDIDLFGLSTFTALTGAKASAKQFLDTRESRKREVKDLAMRFAVAADGNLRRQFREALSRFPDELPYETEEELGQPGVARALKERALLWAPLGNIENYRKYNTATNEVLVAYERPTPLTAEQDERFHAIATSLQEKAVLNWAVKSANEGSISNEMTLEQATAFAKERDKITFSERTDVGEHSAQSTVSAVAAVAILFGADQAARDWAWDVMSRVSEMKERPDTDAASRIPWHPAYHLIVALVHDR
jgi:hypothetical protein